MKKCTRTSRRFTWQKRIERKKDSTVQKVNTHNNTCAKKKKNGVPEGTKVVGSAQRIPSFIIFFFSVSSFYLKSCHKVLIATPGNFVWLLISVYITAYVSTFYTVPSFQEFNKRQPFFTFEDLNGKLCNVDCGEQ